MCSFLTYFLHTMTEVYERSANVEEYEIGKDIFITSKTLRRYMDRNMPCEVLTGGQGRILGAIVMSAERGEDIYQKDLESEFHIRGSSVTGVLQLMERKGLITREASSKDGRLKRILPTSEGIRMHEIVSNNIIQNEQGLKSVLIEEEMIALRQTLKKLRDFAGEETIKEGGSVNGNKDTGGAD